MDLKNVQAQIYETYLSLAEALVEMVKTGQGENKVHTLQGHLDMLHELEHALQQAERYLFAKELPKHD